MVEETACFAGDVLVHGWSSKHFLVFKSSFRILVIVDNPTYEQVKAHKTGHTEAVKVWFDTDVTYKAIVDLY